MYPASTFPPVEPPSRPWRLVSGHRYAYLRVRGVGRVSFPLSGCTTDLEADQRTSRIARVVQQLVAVGRPHAAGRLGAALGRATSPAEVEEALFAVGRALDEGRAPDVLTVEGFAEQWLSGELARRYPDQVKPIRQGDNRSRFETHIFRVIGRVPIADLRLEHGEKVMAAIPPARSAYTRRHVAQCLVRMARLAEYPARVLAHNPFPSLFLPRLPKAKDKPFLYPKEDARLLGCTAIPLRRRLVYGLLDREGMRAGELVGTPGKHDDPPQPPMPWTSVDLEAGALNDVRNKTGDDRTWALAPGVARALGAWRAMHPKNPLIIGEMHDLAQHVRADLEAAGVTRSALLSRSGRARWFGVHCFRATFVTLSLAAGKTETWVQDRTGHKSTTMINAYRRAARNAGELGLGELVPLDEAIPELRR